MASERLKISLAQWQKEAKSFIEKAEKEGRELTSEEKKHLRERKSHIITEEKEFQKSQRLEKKEKKKKIKAESKRLLKEAKESYNEKYARIEAQWKKELEEAQAVAIKENRSLSKLEKQALKARKKELLAKVKEEYKSQRISIKTEVKKEKQAEKEEQKSQRIEIKKEKQRKKLQERYEYEKLQDKYLENWQKEIARIHSQAEKEGRDLTAQEKNILIQIRKKNLKDCKVEWKSQRVEARKKEKEERRKEKEERAKIRAALGEKQIPPALWIGSAAAVLLLLLAFITFSGKKKSPEKNSPSQEVSQQTNTSTEKTSLALEKTTSSILEKREETITVLLLELKKAQSEEHYGEALDKIEKSLSQVHKEENRKKLLEQKEWILTLAKEGYEEVEVESRGKAGLGNLKGAREALSRLKKWKIKSYEEKALALAREVEEIAARVEKANPRLLPFPPDLLQKISLLEKEFLFEKALSLWQEILLQKKYAIPPLMAKFLPLELEAQKKHLEKFISMTSLSRLIYPEFQITPVQKGRIVSANKDGFSVKFEKGQIGFSYPQIEGEKLIKILQWKDFTAEDYFHLGILAYRLGLTDKAHDVWIRALKKEESLQSIIHTYLAYKKGIAVPSEGFQIFQDHLLTPEEKEIALQKHEISLKVKALVSSKKEEKWEEYFDKLPFSLRSYAAELLQQEQERLIKNYQKKVDAFKKIKALKQELNRRREEALQRIFNEDKYYKKKTKEVVGQDWVEEAVAKVRELWENPLSALSRLSPEFQAFAGKLHLVSTLLRKLGGTSAMDEEMEEVLRQATSRLSLKTVCLNEKELKLLRYNQKVMEFNEKNASQIHPQEAREILITNQYRIMMGLHALKMDTRLTQAARKHSKEMKEMGYFDHDSPNADRKTPSKRVKLEGYDKGVVGENIYMGSSSPEAAHKGWYNSPPHHRNILQGDYEDIGVGDYVDHWTQNFGGSGKFKL